MPIIENKVNKIEDEYPPVKESEKQKNHAELPQASQSEPIKLNNSVLASMAAKRQEKIAVLTDKVAILEARIQDNKAKIDKWTQKIQRAESKKAFFKEMISTDSLPKPVLSFFKSMAERQEEKVEILKSKIQKKNVKNISLKQKIQQNNNKISKHKAKIDRLQNTDKFLSDMKNPEALKGDFVSALQDFRKQSLYNCSKKSLKIDSKIARMEEAINKADTSLQKVKLRNKIAKLEDKKSDIDRKIAKLEDMTEKLESLKQLPDEQVEQIVNNSVEQIENQIKNNNNLSEEIVDSTVINEADKAITDSQKNVPDNDKDIKDKLLAEIDNDMIFIGEITFETAKHIKEAGFSYENGKLEKATDTIGDDFYDYTRNGIINYDMEKAVSQSDGKDKMVYLQITQEQADFLKSRNDLEFAIFESKPNTNNTEKRSGILRYQISFRASNSESISNALAAFKNEIDNPLKNTEMAIEENYNNIDGVLNNIPADKSENTKRNPKKTNPFSKEAIAKSAKTITSKPKQVEDKNKSHQRSQGIEKK